jgi:imidazole glycerol-phosphate synthase subunit HisH
MVDSASIVIIDYGSGNLRSVAKAFERVASNVVVSSDVSLLESANHIVLPGVGAFADCMSGLSSLPDMLDVLNEQVRVRGKWFLGVCVGMQMLFENGYEHGIHKGLGWLKGDVVPITSPTLKIPHMGWNNLQIKQKSALLKNVDNGDHAYFVHSYHAKLVDDSHLLAVTEYGGDITAIVGKDNIFGTQFHPEKSQKLGLQIIENFVGL